MSRPPYGLAGVMCALALLSAACSARSPLAAQPLTPASRPQAAAAAPAAQRTPVPAAQSDPAAELIALSTRHFEEGQRELKEGHLETARARFDSALAVLMESPGGARTEPRLREHFDRLVEQISAFEVSALAQGDGFVERSQEPARIDELLAESTFTAPEATRQTADAVAEDLQLTRHDVEIPLNDRVLSLVELFSGRLKNYLADGLTRGAQYLPMVQEVFRAEGLPLDLAYVPLIESAFKPTAVSRAKAKGIWQFMRGTALENGLKHDWYIDERADPEKATRAAAKYLKTLHKMFDGDWHLALASYNGGPGRVQRALKRSGKTDFWSLSATSAYLPRETREYVPLILAAIVVAKNPAQYGIDAAPPAHAPDVDRVALRTAIDLRRIAEWAGVPVQQIQELNPELRRWTTPLRATDYELKVPAGTGTSILARLADTDPSDLAPLNRHTVRKGETLVSIARKLKVSRTDLAEANYLPTGAKLQAGQQLIIPRAPTLLLATNPDRPAPVADAEPQRTRPQAQASASRPAAPDKSRTEDRVIHRVRSGETLFSIARLYRTTVDSLKRWNSLRGNIIKTGQRLTIMSARTVATN